DAGRRALDKTGRWHVPVAGIAAWLRRQRTDDSRARTRRVVRPGKILLRSSTDAKHAAPGICEPQRKRDGARRGHACGIAEVRNAQTAAGNASSRALPRGAGL